MDELQEVLLDMAKNGITVSITLANEQSAQDEEPIPTSDHEPTEEPT